MRSTLGSLSLTLALGLTASLATAQPAACGAQEKLIRDYGRCVPSEEVPTFALGNLRIEDNGRGTRYVLNDVDRGHVNLELTSSLEEFVRESPAESFEIEGYAIEGLDRPVLLVTSLRPIE